MGVFEGSHRRELPSRCRVGRDWGCDLRIDGGHVSREHAVVFWGAGSWHVRDLGSRNGTWVGAQRLEPGVDVAIGAGEVVVFGAESERWTLTDAASPRAFARADDATEAVAEDGVIALPGGGGVEIPVVLDGAVWRAELDPAPATSSGRELKHGDQLTLGPRTWTFFLPFAQQPTQDAAQPLLEEVALTFVPSGSGASLRVETPSGPRELPERAWTRLLMELAKVRLQDDPDLPPDEQGWTYIEVVADELGVHPSNVNVNISRARRAFADAGVRAAADIVERRPGTGQLRLGVARVAIGG